MLTDHMANLEPLVESDTGWGDIVPFSEYPNNDWPDMGWYGMAFSTIDDRLDGRNYPIYRNEQDLARIRATTRRFISISELTESIMTALKVYTFGKGVAIDVQPMNGVECPQGLIENVKRVVDRFCENNSFQNSFDYEAHYRSRDDGECQISLQKDEMRPRQIIADFLEADNLCQPLAVNNNDFVDWLVEKHGIDCDSFVPSWSFGVLTSARRTSRPLAYHVRYDSGGTDWDVFSADEFVHIKRNVTRAMKRGISDWFAIKDRIAQSAKLMSNMAHGAALQAAIAWVEESPAGTTAGQLRSITPADASYQKPTGLGAGGGTRTQTVTMYRAGSILRPTFGRTYKAGPMGAERNQGFEVVEMMIERLAGTRFNMPYFMISGDNSQGSFTNALVAESPFVKARECDQQFYGGAFQSLIQKAVLMAWKFGWLDIRGIPIHLIWKYVDVKLDFPQVATRDRTALVKQLVDEIAIGATSVRTASVDLGRDYDKEVELGAKPAVGLLHGGEQGASSGATSDPSQSSPMEKGSEGELANASTLQFRRNVKAINEILTNFKAGTSSRAHAKQLLLSVGMQDARAEALLDDAAAGSDVQTASTVESVKIMESTFGEYDDDEDGSSAPNWNDYP